MTFQPQPAPAVAYPEGAPGIRMSVEAVAQGMRNGRIDASVRGWAIDVLKAAGLDGRNNPSTAAQAQALLDAIQKQTIYVPDPAGAEWIPAAHVTLCLRDRCTRGDDCDGLTVALGSAMLSVGLPAYAVKVYYGEGHQQHILVGLVDESGKYLYADPSTNRPIQRMVPQAVEEIWVDPLEQVGSLGTAGAEMVTLAAPMKRELYFKGGHWFEFRYGQWWLHAGGKWLPGPVDYQAKGLPGLSSPFKRNGSWWVSNGEVDIEVEGPSGLAAPLPTTPTPNGDQNPTQVSLTDPSGKYTQSIADLATMVGDVTSGDSSLASGAYDTAIQSYQQAGNLGAQTIGPEIDAAGAPGVTQPFTQPAWSLNVALAAINSTGSSPSATTLTTGQTPTQGDAQSAQALAYAMLSYYEQAIMAGSGAKTSPSAGGTPPANHSAFPIVAALSLAGGLGYVGWLAYLAARRA